MGFYWKGFLYSMVIDPMLGSMQRAEVTKYSPGATITAISGTI
jgi:hypothetical protein